MAWIGQVWRHPGRAAKGGIDKHIKQGIIAAIAHRLSIGQAPLIGCVRLRGAAIFGHKIGRSHIIALVLVHNAEIARAGTGLTILARAQRRRCENAEVDSLGDYAEEKGRVAVRELAEDRISEPVDAAAILQAVVGGLKRQAAAIKAEPERGNTVVRHSRY